MRRLLTDKQAEVKAYVLEHWRDNISPPSYRDIQRHFDYGSYNSAQSVVAAIVAKGELEVTPLGILPKGMEKHVNAFFENHV